MLGQERRAAVAAYKERKIPAGVYALRCAPTGEAWVGAAPDLGTIQNRIWFQLRMGGCPFPTLQAAWNAHGEDAIAFEVLEGLPEETLPYARNAALKERRQHWAGQLGARII
ncbi:GIY-YIG nuclease family protein [Roseomonas sp. SSH11]|uniref:GIY-YIG nuclease family protein n=1 Tax=Pararoseomonas baculiformis TaxID=2820812 RepID=A0ABS4ABX1_9PROT|nr:GIY-YIG nuclease family protein [Pararoseomonas baculiformis]MBP0444517.1 GIY-YIG nuclease family protein [Pararoseomonas baculiformis]